MAAASAAAGFASALFSAASSATQQAAAAASALSKPTIQGSYVVDASAPLAIGVWTVTRARHRTNGTEVSIWTADKARLSSGGPSRGRPSSSERAVEVLRKETSVLSRLRHPSILQTAEPMEETRSSITFATEPISASLRHAIAASSKAASPGSRSRHSSAEDSLELDEVEIQKGLGQIALGLRFCHESAKVVHGNLNSDAIVINAKGDWKLSGFGLSTALFGPDGVPARWSFPEYDRSIAGSLQHDYDYLAPEHFLDESPPSPSNDLYALGCLIHSIYTHTGPPFSNRQSLENARINVEEGLSRGMLQATWRKLPQETQVLLAQLLTRYPSSRLSAAAFHGHSYFSSILVSTLRFLERDSFHAQGSEAQSSFLKGLLGVLPRYSEKVLRRKVLPMLLEETRKGALVPFLLPNILYVASKMETDVFRVEVLPTLKPLFTLKEPPQAVLSLLDCIPLLVEKTTPTVFREEVMPLLYSALESDNPVVLDKALRVVPGLSETLDYSTVKQVLFPKITAVFSKTTMLSVKVATLICFHSMIKTLDTLTLTTTLVPLLSKIKTKEPSVMIATLAVHEELGKKCGIDAIATLILPQLWSMSIGPLLNAGQFAKFMSVIKKLSDRVEKEHSQALGDLKRLEETSGSSGRGGIGADGEIDFESLVRGGTGKMGGQGKPVVQDLWADDSQSTTPRSFSPALSPALGATPASQPSLRLAQGSSRTTSSLGARPLPAGSLDSRAFHSPPVLASMSSFPAAPSPTTYAPTTSLASSFAPMQPSRSTDRPAAGASMGATMGASMQSTYGSGRPNYDLSLASQAPPPMMGTFASYQAPQIAAAPAPHPRAWNVIPPTVASPGFGGGILQPTVVKKPTLQDWKDLDPLG